MPDRIPPASPNDPLQSRDRAADVRSTRGTASGLGGAKRKSTDTAFVVPDEVLQALSAAEKGSCWSTRNTDCSLTFTIEVRDHSTEEDNADGK